MNRYIEIKEVPGKADKLTYAPHTGRVSLKISQFSTDEDRKVLLELVEKLKNTAPDDTPHTIRGSVRKNEHGYFCWMKDKCGNPPFYIEHKRN